VVADPAVSSKGAKTGAGGDSRLPGLRVLTSRELPPLGSLLWSCQCHRVSNSIYETLHPWWHVASTAGPLAALAYLRVSCTHEVPDMGMDKSLAIGGVLELPLVSSVILVMCIIGVILENYSGAKPPL